MSPPETIFECAMQPRQGTYVRPPVPKHFVKAILPSPIHENQLRIPEEFIARFGTEISDDEVTISVPDGRTWKLGLKKCEGHVYFCNNWKEFANYYSICYGSYLVFKYEGNSNFSVIIFDSTSTEINYPLNKVSSLKTTIDADLASSRMSKSASERAFAAAIAFMPKHPHFVAIVKHVFLYVPSNFASKYLKPEVHVKLQKSNGEEWPVSCILIHPGTLALRMVKGIAKFLEDNDLSEGDICVFELIKKKHPVVLQFTTFLAVDYAN